MKTDCSWYPDMVKLPPYKPYNIMVSVSAFRAFNSSLQVLEFLIPRGSKYPIVIYSPKS